MAKQEHNYTSGRIRRAQPQTPSPAAPPASVHPKAPRQRMAPAPIQPGLPRQPVPPAQSQPQRMPAANAQRMPAANAQRMPAAHAQRMPAAQSQQAHQNPNRPLVQQMPTASPRPPVQKLPVASVFEEMPPHQPDTAFMAGPAAGAAKARGPRSKKNKKLLLILLLVLALLLATIGGFFGYLNGIFDTGLLGAITSYTPKDYSKKDMVNILIVGIDNEEGRDYGAGLGLTDMILYASFDLANNKLHMLQIPRDSYVGEEVPTGGTGKINAVLISGPDKQNPINNLVKVVEEDFRLPIDHYIAMDMDALKTIVDTFGGLRVFVPQEMNYAGSYLPQGWQWLNGDAAEFFVRNRKGPGFEQADLARLDNQRHFYSALFRRFMNLTPGDMVKLLPVFEHYCNTDIGMKDIFDLAFSALKLQPENVLFCKVPGATNPALDPTGQGRSLYFVDVYGRGTPEDPGVAALLNEYFRTHSNPVPAQDLGLPNITIPPGVPLYPPNVQGMSSVQEGEGGADVDVEPTA